jgi:hypothetical protein
VSSTAVSNSNLRVSTLQCLLSIGRLNLLVQNKGSLYGDSRLNIRDSSVPAALHRLIQRRRCKADRISRASWIDDEHVNGIRVCRSNHRAISCSLDQSLDRVVGSGTRLLARKGATDKCFVGDRIFDRRRSSKGSLLLLLCESIDENCLYFSSNAMLH